MKIHLKNFRCYEDREFDFGEMGLVLLSGASGSGKSTILNGIYFALYGEGTKVIMYGKTNCKVEVDFGDMKIVRTKRPNHLSVTTKKQEDDDTYEDQSAQDIINKRFGDMFDITGYVSQNAINSFVLMSPIDKLSFLEKFAFKDIDISDVKGRCKAIIKDRKETHIAISSQLEMAVSMLSQIKQPEKILLPFKSNSQANMEKLIKNEEVKHKNCGILIKKARRLVKELSDNLSSLKVLETNIKNKTESIETIDQKLSKLELEKEKITYKGDELLEKYETILVDILTNKKIYTLKTKYSEDLIQFNIMKDNELTEIMKELKHINEILWSEYTNKGINDSIIEQKQLFDDIESVSRLEKEKMLICLISKEKMASNLQQLKSYRDTLDEKKRIYNRLKLQKEIYTCPKCKSDLSFFDNKLCETKETKDDSSIEDIEKDIKKITYNITTIESEISIIQNNYRRHEDIQSKIDIIRNKYDDISVYTLEEIKDDIEYMKTYKDTHIKFEKRKKELDLCVISNKFSSTLTTMQTNLEKQLASIKSLEKKTKESGFAEESEVDVRNTIEIQRTMKNKLDGIKTDVNILKEEKQEFERNIESNRKAYLDLYNNITDTIELETKISEKEAEIEELEKKYVVYTDNLKKIEKYKEYKKELDAYNNWIQKKDEIEIQEKKDRTRYAASTLLMEKILEAESIAILNVVNSINTHVQIYLDCFFPDNPLTAKLLTFKETKKLSKPQINMVIEYKGMECDMNMLSGGELSRVVLAFTLALGEMFNTPIILLDECTSSLDQDLSGIIINGIRENFSNKLVVVISHQNVCGIYDRVIEIKN